jgi:hypothetical protein
MYICTLHTRQQRALGVLKISTNNIDAGIVHDGRKYAFNPLKISFFLSLCSARLLYRIVFLFPLWPR